MSATIKTFIEKYLLNDSDFEYYYTYLQDHPASSIVRSFNGDRFLYYLRGCCDDDEMYNLCKNYLDQPENASEVVKLITSRMYLIIVLDMFFTKVKDVTVGKDTWRLSAEAFDPNAMFCTNDWIYKIVTENNDRIELFYFYIYFTPNTFHRPQWITISSNLHSDTKKYSFKLDSPTVFIEHIKWLIGDNK